MNDMPIKLFTTSTCSHCKDLKRLLKECEFEFEFIDVDLLQKKERKSAMKELRLINPKGSFPTLQVGSKVVVGFKEEEIMEFIGK